MATFKGGVHPNEAKNITENNPIVVINDIPDEMIFPVSQHIGNPAKVIVNIGDEVKVGQVLAECDGLISATVVSSVSGKVKSIEKHLDINGMMTDCIIVENDHLDTKVSGFGEKRNYNELSNENIIQIVKDAGIVGLGGAGFPTYVKISPKNPEKIDYVLVNGAECEPYLTSDYRLMLEQGDKLINGLKVLLKLFPNAKGLICIEDNKPLAIDNLKKLCSNENNISVCELKTKYPQGGERQLIYSATGRKINSKKLPADVGCIVQNVDTVISIYNAVCLSTPLIRRIMTLSGYCFNNPGNYEVRLGMSYEHLIEKTGGIKNEFVKCISGGPMMGTCIYNFDVPVAKNSSGILTFDLDDVIEGGTNCINCGRCVSVCPANLVPARMANASEKYDLEAFIKLNGLECMECGCCTFVCPAKRPLTQNFKIMKKRTRNYIKEKQIQQDGGAK